MSYNTCQLSINVSSGKVKQQWKDYWNYITGRVT